MDGAVDSGRSTGGGHSSARRRRIEIDQIDRVGQQRAVADAKCENLGLNKAVVIGPIIEDLLEVWWEAVDMRLQFPLQCNEEGRLESHEFLQTSLREFS